MSLASKLLGTWESDHDRTLWELRRTLGPNHAKTEEYFRHRDTLVLHRANDLVTYHYRDMTCVARYRILAEDENSVVTEVEPCDLNQQRLWHIHVVTPDCYWVTVDLDWGLIYREFFKRLKPAA
jgi:hypothetical protein